MKNIPYDHFLKLQLHVVANDLSLYTVHEIQNMNGLDQYMVYI